MLLHVSQLGAGKANIGFHHVCSTFETFCKVAVEALLAALCFLREFQ